MQGTPLVSWTTFLYFLGFCVTAVFVALGAPFWFDLLGRVMKMRAAGEKPSTEASKDPAAKPAGGKDAAKTDGDGPVTPKGGGPFADSRNDFEALLTDADRVELQTLLGVKPTGRLDEETRRAIVVRAKALGVDLNGKDELSLLAYMAIVGRHPAALLNLGGGSLFAAKVGVLAPQLSQLLGFPLSEALQPAHRRALAMRYLFKQALDNRSDSPSLQDLDAMARSRAINRLDDWAEPARRPLEALTEDDLVKILKAGPPPRFNRSTTPWLDWAFGELGQFEENKSAPEASNPRVVEYLRAAGVMTGGDATPWCGAFAAWVVQRYNDEYPKAKLPDPPKDPETAENWKTWGVGLTQTETPQAGDIAIFNQDGDPLKFHVTWVVRVEADGRLRVIGGNQGDGCVSLAIRGGANDKVVKVCRGSTGAGGQAPVPPPPPPAPAPAPAPAP
ncbi:CHAP domain-containing protein [Roseateles chitinivorans]|uniref:CHAP domain-containing protein n=1 Tax=Roseateles chitinivorans TaxID=2917965 RepID=UPI003D66B39C